MSELGLGFGHCRKGGASEINICSCVLYHPGYSQGGWMIRHAVYYAHVRAITPGTFAGRTSWCCGTSSTHARYHHDALQDTNNGQSTTSHTTLDSKSPDKVHRSHHLNSSSRDPMLRHRYIYLVHHLTPPITTPQKTPCNAMRCNDAMLNPSKPRCS